MLFNSLSFALFFLLVTGLHFTLPHRFRWILMLAASYYFYMCWSVGYILLILTSTLITWFCALQIARGAATANSTANDRISDKEASQNRRYYKKKLFLIVSLTANLGALFFFKYYNFFTTSLFEISASFNLLQSHDAPLLHLMMPVGISFYTFQIVSYTIDVYKGKIPAEKHPGIFALYVAFWPRLVAGPIERAGRLIPQFRKELSFDYTKAADGLRLVLRGMIKKVVIADQLAIYVNQVFDHCGDYSGAPLIVASIFFTIQIYCDFSGYSDMAVGTARVMGYELTENFRHPYFAASLREFWQRWHISLSTWFRDYLYIPLGGNRVKRWRFHYNLFITFLVSGLWHGASWNFVIWGGLHGIYLIVENILEDFFSKVSGRFSNKRRVSSLDRITSVARPSGVTVSDHSISESFLYKGFRIAGTLFLVNYAWIFFRANTLSDAFSITGKMFLTGGNPVTSVVAPSAFILNIVLISFLVFVEIGEQTVHIKHFWKTLPLAGRWSFYVLGFWAVAISTVFGVKQDFIYFQF
ncbi:MAG: MBOAT family O-acyltransferase [Desulfobacterium sp.]|nr:MBOAT family O-acyltransferase [Desulfobacterium sp.]